MAEGNEQRRGIRLPLSGPITIVMSSGRRLQGQAMDVSLLGCRFRAEAPLQVGDRITTVLLFASGKNQVVEGTIKFVTSGPPYQHSVVFTQETTEQIIKHLIKIT